MSSDPSPTVLETALAEARADDWRARAAALRAELDSEGDRARAAVIAYELGELSERHLRDEAGAVKAYGRALQSDPSYRPNLWAIRRVFYRRGLWPNLLKLIDAEIRFARSHVERADLYVEKGQILEERLGDQAGARDAYERAIALLHGHVSALLRRERIAFQEGDGNALLRLWRLLADATTHPGRKSAYLLDLARLTAQNDIRSALGILDEAAAAGGLDPMVIARERERFAEVAGDAEMFLAALDARIALTRNPIEAAALRRHQARVATSAGGETGPERAWGYLEQAARVLPEEPLLLFDMADLAEDSGKLDGLAAILARLHALEPNPTRRMVLSLRRADALARSNRGEEADALLDEIVAHAPGYLPVLELRERRALATGDDERLARIRLAEAATARMGTAFGQTDPEPHPAWAAAAYTAAGDLYDLRLGRSDEARAAYQQALETVPGYPPAVEALIGLALRGGDSAEAIALLEGQLEKEAPARAEEMLERLALLYQREGKAAESLGALERLAARRPEDESLWFRLERAYEQLGRHEERAALLLRIAEHVTDPRRRAALLAEVGRVHDLELENPEGAIAAYRAALALEPSDRAVRGALVHLLRRIGRWEELADELRAEADATGGGRPLRAAAAVLERKLAQAGEASAVYRDLLDRTPSDPGAVRALAGTLPESGELAEVLEAEIALLPRGAATAQALVRLGELYERLGRPEDAAAAQGRAVEGAPNPHAAWALFHLMARHGDAAAVAEATLRLADVVEDADFRADLLEELAWLADGDDAAARFEEVARESPRRRGVELGKALCTARRRDAGELASSLEIQAERVTDPRVAAALTLRAATLREVAIAAGTPLSEGAHDPTALAARALARVPDDPGAVLAAVERAAPPSPGARIDVLARRAAMAESHEARSDFDVDRARLLLEAGRLAEAGQILRELLSAVPDNLEALLILHRIAVAAGDDETRASAGLRLGQLLADAHSSALYLTEAARLYDETLRRPEAAAPVWRDLYDLDPSRDDAYQRAHALYEAMNDVAALADLVSRRIEFYADDPRIVPQRLERARLLRKRREGSGAAADLEAILGIDPGHLEALSELADVRLAQGDPIAAAGLLRQYNESIEHPELRADAEDRLAGILVQLGDFAGAIDALGIVLTVHPDNAKARGQLVELHLKTGQPALAAEEMERLADRRSDATVRARDDLQAARLWLRVGDRAKAQKALERSQKLDPLGIDTLRELAALLPATARTAFLEEATTDVRTVLRREGARAPMFAALDAIAELAGDATLAAFSGGALAAMGAAAPETRQKLAERRDGLVAPRPRRALTDEEWRTRLEHAGARGPLGEIWSAVVESVSRAAPWEPAEVGFAKGDRVAHKQLAARLPNVDAAARALGLADVEVYVSAARPGTARAVPLEVPILYLGEDIARAETLETRLVLALALAAARQRLGPLEETTQEDLRLTMAAAVKVGGGDPARLSPAVPPAKLEERVRLVGKASRKDRKLLAAAMPRLRGDESLADWQGAMRATVRRAALLLVGDVETVAARLPAGSGVLADLLAWGVGDSHLHLRSELGL